MSDVPLTLEELRANFDATFAEPAPTTDAGSRLRTLRIKVGERRMVLLASQLAALFPERTLYALPGAPQNLLGVAEVRGGLVPVHCLRTLLGDPRNEDIGWIAVLRGEPSLALAFDTLEGQETASARDLAPIQDGSRFTTQQVGRGRTALPIVDLDAVRSFLQEERERRMGSRPGGMG